MGIVLKHNTHCLYKSFLRKECRLRIDFPVFILLNLLISVKEIAYSLHCIGKNLCLREHNDSEVIGLHPVKAASGHYENVSCVEKVVCKLFVVCDVEFLASIAFLSASARTFQLCLV